MGAWDFVADLISEVATEAGCEHPEPRYAGRDTSASTATGSAGRHRAEQARLLADAFEVGVAPMGRIARRIASRESKGADLKSG